MNATIADLTPWWNRMSAGRETLRVTTAKLFDGNIWFAANSGCASTGVMLDLALRHLKRTKAGKNFDNIVVLFPGNAPFCGWQGLGEIGGRAIWTYANTTGSIWAHELGHNLGFSHANTCFSGYAVTYMKNCTDVEYGNSIDIMGAGPMTTLENASFAPAFLRRAKWLPDDRMTKWSGLPVAYDLYRADRADLGLTAINIPALDQAAGDNSFWLQYNPTVSGYRNQKTSATMGGVVITMSPSTSFVRKRFESTASDGPGGVALADSYLCDLTPGTEPGDNDDPRLLPGMSFTDPRNRFTVTLDSADGTVARVRVEPVAVPEVAPVAAVNAPAALGGARTIRVDITGPTPGRNEPLMYVVDTVEDPGKTCTADVFVPKCVLSGLARDVPYTVRVVAVNGSTRSPPILAPTVTIPSGPPGFDVVVETTNSSIVAKVNVDDGGSPPTSPLTLELPGKRACVVSLSRETVCTFKKLSPRTRYVLTARGANATGVRETALVADTLAAIPIAPKVSGRFVGQDLHFTATAARADASNVTHFGSECLVDGSSGARALRPMAPDSLAADFILESVGGSDVLCLFWALAPEVDKDRGIQLSGSTVIVAQPTGSVRSQRVLVKTTLKSPGRGSVLVRWSTAGSSGVPRVRVGTDSTKPCRPVSSNSCIIRGLKSRSTLKVTINADRGYASARSESYVVVK